MSSTNQPPGRHDTSDANAAPIPVPAASQLRALVAGGFGGVCAVIVGHPFDLIKVRLQTAEPGVYRGAVDAVQKSIARGGLRRGLYAGVSAPLVGVTPMFAVSFWGYDLGKTIIRGSSSSSATEPLSISQIAAAGFLSAVPMTVITAPFERVKVILQVHGQKQLAPGERPRYSGSGLAVVRQLYGEGGLRSVFRGSGATLARDGPGSAAYFAAYEAMKRWLSPPPDSRDSAAGAGAGAAAAGPSLLAVICAGATAGVAMWVSIFPVDTVKSRLQTSETQVRVGTVVRELWRRGGYRAFFPGFGPALARAVPANAATFLGYELAQQTMTNIWG